MVNILEIDVQIRSYFDTEKKELPKLQKQLLDLETLQIESESVKNIIQSLKKKITEIESNSKYNFYLIETAELINNYIKILQTPIKMTFIKPKKQNNEEIKKLEEKYINIIKKYNYDIIKEEQKQLNELKCSNCGNDTFYNNDNIYFICKECYYQIEKNIRNLNTSDFNRINVSSKYTYDRRIHFRECINQHQGIENCMIPNELFTKLEKEFEKHGLLEGKKGDNPTFRFNKITKEHILIFLKELGYSKYYENVILIHSKLTNKKPDDISHLVNKLIIDFDTFIEAYDLIIKDKIERKSFINIQYVLFQLLLRYQHPCKLTDFNLLKTGERQEFHDSVTSQVFNHLGWTFIPMY
jgi:hypothetical protein